VWCVCVGGQHRSNQDAKNRRELTTVLTRLQLCETPAVTTSPCVVKRSSVLAACWRARCVFLKGPALRPTADTTLPELGSVQIVPVVYPEQVSKHVAIGNRHVPARVHHARCKFRSDTPVTTRVRWRQVSCCYTQ
jgi:hypothetical protein